MSLVGPRPLILDENEHVVRLGARRGSGCKPGITGLWQVLGRSEIPFEEMTRLDYLYVTSWSLWGDIMLICRTLPALDADPECLLELQRSERPGSSLALKQPELRPQADQEADVK